MDLLPQAPVAVLAFAEMMASRRVQPTAPSSSEGLVTTIPAAIALPGIAMTSAIATPTQTRHRRHGLLIPRELDDCRVMRRPSFCE